MRSSITVFLLVAAFSLTNGCATPAPSTDLVGAGLVTLDPATAMALHHSPQVRERDGNLVVSGELDPSEAVEGGQVNVTVVGSNGAIVFQSATPYKRPVTERGGPRGQSRGPLFPSDWRVKYSVEFPGLPPAESVVRVRLDQDSYFH